MKGAVSLLVRPISRSYWSVTADLRPLSFCFGTSYLPTMPNCSNPAIFPVTSHRSAAIPR